MKLCGFPSSTELTQFPKSSSNSKFCVSLPALFIMVLFICEQMLSKCPLGGSMKVCGWALCGWSHMAFLTDVASISGIAIISILLTSLSSSGFLIDMMLYVFIKQLYLLSKQLFINYGQILFSLAQKLLITPLFLSLSTCIWNYYNCKLFFLLKLFALHYCVGSVFQDSLCINYFYDLPIFYQANIL